MGTRITTAPSPHRAVRAPHCRNLNQLDFNAETVASRPVPKPAALYRLIVLTLATHAPLTRSQLCDRCGKAWPCPLVRLAYRLREGF